ncbi:MAG: SPOR domain-containing protein [Cytophagales bacterium]|nr:SPOR domain-containing protein [Cytophagales bacterium]
MDKHIRYLLSEGNRVEVPGLGVFTAHYISSQILREQHLILPPRKQVIFTDAEKAEENNSFCHLVMKAEQIDHQAFKTQLESYLNKVYQHIEQHGYYEIPGIGLLKRNAAGKLVLENDTDYNLLNSSYGLPKLFAHPVATQKASVNFETQPQPTSAKIPSSGQQTASKAITREIVLDRLWWLAMIPLIMIFVFLVYLMVDEEAQLRFREWVSGESKQEETIYLQTRDDDSLKPISIPSQASDAISDTPKEATNSIQEHPPSPVSPTQADEVSSGDYMVVLGSLAKESAAKSLQKQLSRRGIATEIIYNPQRNTYRVAITGLSQTAAKHKREELLATFPEAWIARANQ